MKTPFERGMSKATDLTRSGKLHEAVALIQSLLRPAAAGHDQPAPPESSAPDATVIEGDFTRLSPDSAPPKARRGPAKATARTPLAETLRRIAAGGMPAQAARGAAAVPVAPGAQFLSLTHAGPQGSRDYRLYVPAHRPDAPMPLIVMLHGCTQTPEDFATGTGMNALAEEFGFLVAYPGQPSGANGQKCWNWFRPEDQARDRGEPALIAGLTRDILRSHPADPARTYVAGLSAGGAAAVLVAAAYPDLFSAVGVHSGLPAGSARDVASAFSAMRSGTTAAPHPGALPTIAFHGLADGTVHPQNGSAVLSQALHAMPGLRATSRKGTSDGGRTYRTTAHHHPDGRSFAEHWEIDGAGHAWAGGQPGGSHTDPRGPDASRQMLRFFLQHRRG